MSVFFSLRYMSNSASLWGLNRQLAHLLNVWWFLLTVDMNDSISSVKSLVSQPGYYTKLA